MNVLIIEEKTITDEMDAGIRRSLCDSFPKEREVFSKTRAWHDSSPAWSVVLDENSRVLAHVGIIDRIIKVGGENFHIAGIQNVFVIPEYRGKGLSDTVMTTAMRDASNRNYDFGLLFCIPELEKVYAKTGWLKIFPGSVSRVDENGDEMPLPEKNITMYFPLRVVSFPAGKIHLQGNDW
jgi:predicted acetyltransferase